MLHEGPQPLPQCCCVVNCGGLERSNGERAWPPDDDAHVEKGIIAPREFETREAL